ncbi:MAG: response regulator [Verrucomicrobia bacterium]|nr:response regulator [Verrucomicrobiota bacterium]
MKANLLLIEDDPSTAAALQKVMRDEGYQIDVVNRGDDGLRRAQDQCFDVVITDLKLPGLDGRRLTQTNCSISSPPRSPAAGSCPSRWKWGLRTRIARRSLATAARCRRSTKRLAGLPPRRSPC